MRIRPLLGGRPAASLVPAALSTLLSLSLASAVEAAGGPSYPSHGARTHCVPGVHATEHTVAEGPDGRFTRYRLSGSHRFDARGVTFDGLSDANAPVYAPVKLNAAARQFVRKVGRLAEPATVGEERWVEHSVPIPRKTRRARFHVRFDAPDPGRRMYMKITAPAAADVLDIVGPPDQRGRFRARKFVNDPTAAEELAVVSEPTAGDWTVRVAVIGGAGTDVGYELTVDDYASIASASGHLAAPRAGRETHHNHTVRLPEGTSEASFRVRFDRADPHRRLYMKLTSPGRSPVVKEFVSESTDASESRTLYALEAEAGEWSVRVASGEGAGSDVRYALTVDTDTARQPSIGCWSGGTVRAPWDENDPAINWENPYHRSAGMVLETGDFLVEGVSIHGYGDGIQSYGDDNVVDGAYLTDIHDDCIENDDLYDLRVVDSFLDGCYVAFSARSFENVPPFDGNGKLMEIRNSLVRLEAQPEAVLYKPRAGEGPGHGQFFKWNLPGGPHEGAALSLALHDNIFLARQDNRNPGNHGLVAEALGSIASCSGNVIVWLGEGPFPDLAKIREAGLGENCLRISTDENEWRAATAAWHDWNDRRSTEREHAGG